MPTIRFFSKSGTQLDSIAESTGSASHEIDHMGGICLLARGLITRFYSTQVDPNKWEYVKVATPVRGPRGVAAQRDNLMPKDPASASADRIYVLTLNSET